VRRLARYAWFVIAFNMAVIAVGAFVRASGSGAGCGRSWPTCQGVVIPELAGATAVEFTHRTLSGVALILVAALVLLVFRAEPKGAPARKGALLSIVAIVGEALIGAMIVLAEWVAHDASVARAVAVPLHLVNTLFLLAALTLTAFWLGGGARIEIRGQPRSTRLWVAFGATALVLIAATGAVTALADTLFPDADTAADFAADAHFLTRLRLVHPVLAVAAASIAWFLSGRAEGPRGGAANAIPILVGAMILSGSINILLGVPVWMQLVHLVLADSLWIAFVLVAARALATRAPAAVSG
jgi:heme A synthase